MAKPKIALVPSAQGSKFYSVLPSSGVGDFTFSRSGSATRINSQGLIETVGSGVSRLNYPMIDGVVSGCPHHILEPQRTNIFPYSSAFININDFSLTVTDNASISPEGSNNATSIIPNVSNTIHYLSLSNNSTGTVTFSIYAKANGYNYLFLHLYDGSNGRAWFNLENGVIETTDSSISANIEKMPNGWYRCIITRVLSGNLIQADIAVSNSDNTTSFSGDGTSGIYIYGAQLEQGSYPTSYIPNYGTALGVTRSVETANGSGDVDTFNDSEGVFFLEAKTNQPNFFQSISIKDSVGNGLAFKFRPNNTSIWARYKTSTEQKDIYYYNNVNDNYNKLAIVYGNGSISFYINGFLIGSNTITTNFSNLNEIIFKDVNLSEIFYGNIKQIQYYNSELVDSELETLTSWVSFQDMAEGQLYSIQ